MSGDKTSEDVERRSGCFVFRGEHIAVQDARISEKQSFAYHILSPKLIPISCERARVIKMSFHCTVPIGVETAIRHLM